MPQPLSLLAQVVIPILQTLVVAHQQGIIHRDLKPENLFLNGEGMLRVGDWGLAINQLQEKAYLRVGTLDYMAPEVPLGLHMLHTHCCRRNGQHHNRTGVVITELVCS